MDPHSEPSQLSDDLEHQSDEESGTSDIEIVEIEDDQRQDPAGSGTDSANTTNTSQENSTSGGDGKTNRLKNLRCPICLETPEIVAVAPCGHPYCHECIFTALSSMNQANRREGRCSLCRKRVRYDQVIYMEFKVKEKNDLQDGSSAGAHNGDQA